MDVKIICLITRIPNKIWCDFLNVFKKYNIFIIVDDNDYDLCDFINNYKHITFIKVDNEKCTLHGCIDVNFTLKKLISGWDKALYYFGVEYKEYNHIWFIEDDVFFCNEDTILKIDNQYINEDLLSNIYYENKDGHKNTWHWKKIKIHYSFPYYCGMMCAVRFSNKMLNCIINYAKQYKTLFFLEALFPTIAIKNNLQYNTPKEFKNIYYRHNFDGNNINIYNLYHPVKKLTNHIHYREKNIL